jgi:hypothetical protein
MVQVKTVFRADMDVRPIRLINRDVYGVRNRPNGRVLLLKKMHPNEERFWFFTNEAHKMSGQLKRGHGRPPSASKHGCFVGGQRVRDSKGRDDWRPLGLGR